MSNETGCSGTLYCRNSMKKSPNTTTFLSLYQSHKKTEPFFSLQSRNTTSLESLTRGTFRSASKHTWPNLLWTSVQPNQLALIRFVSQMLRLVAWPPALAVYPWQQGQQNDTRPPPTALHPRLCNYASCRTTFLSNTHTHVNIAVLQELCRGNSWCVSIRKCPFFP